MGLSDIRPSCQKRRVSVISTEGPASRTAVERSSLVLYPTLGFAESYRYESLLPNEEVVQEIAIVCFQGRSLRSAALRSR